MPQEIKAAQLALRLIGAEFKLSSLGQAIPSEIGQSIMWFAKSAASEFDFASSEAKAKLDSIEALLASLDHSSPAAPEVADEADSSKV